jgi:hypothetical protein
VVIATPKKWLVAPAATSRAGERSNDDVTERRLP